MSISQSLVPRRQHQRQRAQYRQQQNGRVLSFINTNGLVITIIMVTFVSFQWFCQDNSVPIISVSNAFQPILIEKSSNHYQKNWYTTSNNNYHHHWQQQQNVKQQQRRSRLSRRRTFLSSSTRRNTELPIVDVEEWQTKTKSQQERIATTTTIKTNTEDSSDETNNNVNGNENNVQPRRSFPSRSVTSNTVLLPKVTSAAVVTESLQQFQQCMSGPIAGSFDLQDPYNPLVTNCHIQTIGGFLLRSSGYSKYVPIHQPIASIRRIILNSIQLLVPSSTITQTPSLLKEADITSKNTNDNYESFWDHRQRINTPDGDWFYADCKYVNPYNPEDDFLSRHIHPETGDIIPTVILLHGLNSNSQSGVSMDMASAFVTHAKMNCICLNFRGCTDDEPNDTLRFYHLGFTDDIHHYVQLFNDQWEECSRSRRGGSSIPKPILYIAGFSLGANVALKYLGELGEKAVQEQHNIFGCSVLCAPLDSVRNSIMLGKEGISKQVYTKNLLNGLKGRAAVALERFCNNDINTMKFDYQRVLQSTTITEFDDAFTAQIYGYEDCWDYYSQTSSLHYLDSIAVPTLILNAKDDPFFDSSVWPIEKSYQYSTTSSILQDDDVDEGATVRTGTGIPIKFIQTDHGGHLGFAFHQVPADDTRLAVVKPPLSDYDSNSSNFVSPSCWASVQASKFLHHVQNHGNTILLQQSKQ